jgi:hypothetical protein
MELVAGTQAGTRFGAIAHCRCNKREDRHAVLPQVQIEK